MYRKLSAAEISAVISKIRSRYDDLCKKFFKPRRLKEEFENRYLRALRTKVDISNFLLAEISAVEELIKKEERRIEAEPPKEQQQPVKTNFADKIIAEHKQMIEKYPDVSIHKDCNPEVKKLLGALNQLYEEYFPRLHTLLRSMSTSAGVRDLTTLENQLRQLGYLGTERVSTRLTRYYTLLNRFPRDYRAVEREEKDFILESAFLLHDLADTLTAIREQNAGRTNLPLADFDEIYQYINGMITDFRLKELKRKR